ncbi:MAG: type II toxin-antitoxin system RelE/ParE family toxin [Candidatus Nanohalobium sp.]
MEIELHKQAERELQEFSQEIRQELKSRLKELEDSPAGHENSDRIEVRGRPVFRYVTKENSRGGEIDHRAIYDIKDGKVMVYTVFHRDKGYQKNDIARRF